MGDLYTAPCRHCACVRTMRCMGKWEVAGKTRVKLMCISCLNTMIVELDVEES